MPRSGDASTSCFRYRPTVRLIVLGPTHDKVQCTERGRERGIRCEVQQQNSTAYAGKRDQVNEGGRQRG